MLELYAQGHRAEDATVGYDSAGREPGRAGREPVPAGDYSVRRAVHLPKQSLPVIGRTVRGDLSGAWRAEHGAGDGRRELLAEYQRATDYAGVRSWIRHGGSELELRPCAAVGEPASTWADGGDVGCPPNYSGCIPKRGASCFVVHSVHGVASVRGTPERLSRRHHSEIATGTDVAADVQALEDGSSAAAAGDALRLLGWHRTAGAPFAFLQPVSSRRQRTGCRE